MARKYVLINMIPLFSNYRDLEAFFNQFYIRTVPWISAVMMGIAFAYFLPMFQRASFSKQRIVVNATTLSLITYLSIVGYICTSEQSHMEYLFLQAIWPIGISVILSLLIFIFHPQSQFIDYKISPKTIPFLLHISRILYPLNLTNYILFVALLNGTQKPPMLDGFSILCIFCGYLFVIYLSTIFLYIFIESPNENIRKKFSL